MAAANMDHPTPTGDAPASTEPSAYQQQIQQITESRSTPSHLSAGSTIIDTDPAGAGATKAAEDQEFTNLAPIKPAPTARPASLTDSVTRIRTDGASDENDIFRALSRRKTAGSGDQPLDGENYEIERLLSTIFGQSRQATSEEETRHLGVVFKNLTVKGQGVGATLQETNGDFFLGPVRALKGLFAGTALKPKSQVRTILNGFSGCVRPQEMLLVLGKPGSGCSTFLKTIGNQRSGFEEITGEVTYGGVGWKDMWKKFRGEVLYNPEEDLHYATLTVRETLSFALKTRTPGKEGRAEGETKAMYVNQFLKMISKLFWIEHTLDTKVGNSMVRGVSGGEKKRVSIGEALITKASCQCWDNSTKGLDASTAMEYVSSLRSLTNMTRISTFVALYQAGESLYNLFDKVILIDQGRCVYFGRTEDAKAYFESLGFVCPPRWTTADFLTSVTDPHERHVKPGWEDRIPRNAEEFETAFKNSEFAKKNLEDIHSFEAEVEEQKAARAQEVTKATKTKNYTIPFHQQVLACTSRQFKVMRGDPMSLGGKWGGVLFQSLIAGSLFYNLAEDVTGVFPRGGIMFLTLMMNALIALAELTSSFDSRPMMLKHKSFSFYRPSAYAIAQVVTDIPLTAIQVLIWDIVIYFMCNLQRTASQFFIFVLFTFVLTLSIYSFFRMVGSFSGNLDSATRITGLAIQGLIVYTGYLIPPSSMHPWLSWLRWINPVQYAFEALMANEFYSLDIKCVPPYIVPPPGPGVTSAHQSCLLRGSQPGITTVRGSDYIKSQFGYTRSHLWRDFGIVVAFWLFFVVLTAVGLELQKPNRGGASVTVYKRGQTPEHVNDVLKKAPSPADEETGEKRLGVNKSPLGENSGMSPEEIRQRVAKNDTIFTWQNVTYTIPVQGQQKVLLNNVSGYVRPGRLTALMGESGAGKTTLLNALAQRIKFGTVTGSFLVDGQPLPLSFQRATGFAEQQDIHEPTTTVREALRFSALLRQPKEVPVQEKYDYADQIIHLLEMDDIAGATVGAVGSGLNEEQRKRLTIGVELASKPELLMFLDEPTSGLDSGAAFNIIRFLRKLADAGQAILCTIHQPSAVLFENFDELVLLKSGGRVVYHGPLGKDSHTMIQYFERNGAPTCPKDKNPAEYMLEAIGAGDPNRKEKDWGLVWQESPECVERTQEIEQFILERHVIGSSKKVDNRTYAMPWTSQVSTVVWRNFISFWRSPTYVVGMFALHIFTGLFNSFTFYKLGFSLIDMQSRLFSVFMTLVISPPLIQQLQPRFIFQRNLFTSRESNSKIYHWSAFVISSIVVEIPYRIVAGTLYFAAWYWPIEFPRHAFNSGYTWMMLMVFELYYLGFGMAIASFAENELLASILVPAFFIFIISFCGVVVPFHGIPTFWRRWLYYISPFTYIFGGFFEVVTHDTPVHCSSKELAVFTPPSGMTCQQYVQPFINSSGGYVNEQNGECQFCQYADGAEYARAFNLNYDNKWRDYGVSFAFTIFNFVLVFVCTWLYLGGLRRLRARFSKKTVKTEG